MIAARVDKLGKTVLELIEGYGDFTRFCFSTAAWMFTDGLKPRRWRLVWPQMYEVGTKSIPIVMLTGAFIGMVLAMELYEQFRNFGQEQRLGGIIGLTVVRHLGPVLAAVMLAGRVGGAFAAELGTMNVTEQIDALRVMGAAPISYLVVPRLTACIVMIPIMTVFSDIVGSCGGWMITVSYGVTSHDYWQYSALFVESWDIFSGLVKSLFFGISIGLICCYKGFNCKPGAQGVGQATTEAFVTSFIAIIILNFFLAKFTKDLYVMLFGYEVFIPFG